MANELSLFSEGGMIPAYLKWSVTDVTKALMGRDNKRISFEGGVFRMIVGGQEVAINEERAMNFIILRAAEKNSRAYYAGKYVKGEAAKPTCWSNDSEKPDDSIQNPQAATCAQCPQNIKGSGDREDSRACRFSRKVALLLEDDLGGDIYGANIPAMSVFAKDDAQKMGLIQYSRFLGGHGIDVSAVVTEFRFDTQAEGVKIQFKPVRPLQEAEFQTVLSRRNEEAAIQACTMTVGALDETPANQVPVSGVKEAEAAAAKAAAEEKARKEAEAAAAAQKAAEEAAAKAAAEAAAKAKAAAAARAPGAAKGGFKPTQAAPQQPAQQPQPTQAAPQQPATPVRATPKPKSGFVVQKGVQQPPPQEQQQPQETASQQSEPEPTVRSNNIQPAVAQDVNSILQQWGDADD